MRKHKTLGQVFTPQWVVVEILDLMGYVGNQILNKYIIEPASGNGIFLMEIVKRYIDICLKEKIQSTEIIRHLETYIYAVEIDENEYKKSIQSLNTLVTNKLGINQKPNWKIYNRNTLHFYQTYADYFDFVVGNPPYIRIHNLDISTRNFLKNNFLFSDGTIDIYLSFFEMGLKMLNKNGILGYITPNSYLHNSSYAVFRDYLKREKLVKVLIDFKANKIFTGFSTYTAITILQKNNTKEKFTYKELVDDKIKFINTIFFEALNNRDWSFTNTENENFLVQITKNRNVAIKDFFDVQYGFATLRDKIFIGKIEKNVGSLVFFNNSWIEKDILKKVIKGSRFKGTIDEQDRIFFPYELVNNRYIIIPEEKLKSQFPNAYKYLLKNKKELELRDMDKGALWYEFGRSQGIQTIHNEKIVMSTLINGKIEYYKVPADVLMYSGLFIIKNKKYSDWKIIEDTLSSEEFYKYIRLTGKDFSGGYKSLTSKQIKEFKIKVHNPEKLF